MYNKKPIRFKDGFFVKFALQPTDFSRGLREKYEIETDLSGFIRNSVTIYGHAGLVNDKVLLL